MTTTDDAIAVVRRAIDAYERGDDAQLRTLYVADHAEPLLWHQPSPLPGDDTQPLLDRYEQANANALAASGQSRTTIEEQFACGDQVVTVLTMQAPPKRAGRRSRFVASPSTG